MVYLNILEMFACENIMVREAEGEVVILIIAAQLRIKLYI